MYVQVIEKTIVIENMVVSTEHGRRYRHIRDHLDVFNRLASQLSGVQTKIEEKDEAKLMLTPLPPLYDTLATILLVGKETLTLEHQEANE